MLLSDVIAMFFTLKKLWQALVFWFAGDLIEHIRGIGPAKAIYLFPLEPT